MTTKAVILSTGDELTTGRVIDTNSAFIADHLSALGIEVAAVLKVGDDKDRLLWALGQACGLGEIIIGTGGLGPTADDLTSEVVAEFLGCKLVTDEPTATALKQRFAARHLPWTPNNLKQARFPEGSTILANPLGTAPGFRVPLLGKTLFWLSGVPHEMSAMIRESVLPSLAREGDETSSALACTFKIYGLTESKLDDALKAIPVSQQVKLSFRAHYPDLSLRLTVRGEEAYFQRLKNQIKEILGAHIYGEGEEVLEQIVGKLLVKKKLTLALAESCTGGYISHRITRVAGSSAYFKSSAVTYSNEAKIEFLGVKPETLERHGAVSRETALEMAEGIRNRAEAGIGLSVTGIAGPSGGSPEKPVGTVWMALARSGHSDARRYHFHGERERIIVGASQAALDWLRRILQEEAGHRP